MHQQSTSDANKKTTEKDEAMLGHESKDAKMRDPAKECARFLESWVSTYAQARETREVLKRLTEQLELIVKNATAAPVAGSLLSIKEAAQFLSLSERTIRSKVATREWPAYRCGTAVRVDPVELRTRMKQAR